MEDHPVLSNLASSSRPSSSSIMDMEEEVAVTPSPFLGGGGDSNHPRSTTPDLPNVCSKIPRNSPRRQRQRNPKNSMDSKNTPTVPPRVVSSSSAASSEDTTTSSSSGSAHNSVRAAQTADDNNDKMATELSSPRRSGRERTATCIQIDGHTIKKDNFYVVKGCGYKYGDLSKVDSPKKRKNTNNHHQNSTQTTKKPRRILGAAEMERHEHNDAIKQRVQDKAPLRLAHLAKHLTLLEPFLDEATKDELQQVAAAMTTTKAKAKPTNHHETVQSPKAIQAEMRDYQLKGLQWMAKMHEKNLGMILGDEMGLGKTLQTISLFCHLKETYGITGPNLVICPLSVLYSWCNEVEKWAPSLKLLRFHSSCETERNAQRDLITKNATNYDVVVTTYEMAKQPQLRHLWSRQYFHYLVLDEGHRIKDAHAQISQAVRGIHCENKLILTGTPLQNNLVELWSLLNFLYPDVFVSSEPFAQAFDISLNIVHKETLNNAKQLLGLFMIRRLKDQVEKLMPKKMETKVLCPLSSTQVFWYKALLLKDISILAKVMATTDDDDDEGTNNSTQGTAKRLSNLCMQLRKICLHPFLFEGAETNIDETSLEDLIAASGKLAVLDKLLMSLYQKGNRTVLFSQFTSVLDILEDYCIMRGWSYCRFDGSTARATRNYIVNSFNQPNSDKFIFLMSTRSGGMGLNLQTADTCILYDSDWNPQPDLQAMARVHRIGQTKIVHVYRLVTHGTIEERMVERAEKKLYMDRMVNSTGGEGVEDEVEDVQVPKKDIVSTLRFGCNAVFGQDAEARNTLPSDADIDNITDRSRSEESSHGNLKGGVAIKTDDFEANKVLSATTKLGGVDFQKIRDEERKKRSKLDTTPKDLAGISHHWRQIQDKKRKSKSRLVMVDGKNSGYGMASVPVLAANNYDLLDGESSVFARELQGNNKKNFATQKKKMKKSGVDFESQDFCQACGDGGTLICCPRCPVSIHVKCAGLHSDSEFHVCSHHRCAKCNKNTESAGGILFACQSCPNAYCEDCTPKDSTYLDTCERFETLGFTTRRTCYIHCAKICENVAKTEFGWKPAVATKKPCPPPLDVSASFGAKVDEALEAKPEETASRLRPRRGKRHYGGDMLSTFGDVPNAPPAQTSAVVAAPKAPLPQKPVAQQQNDVIDLTDSKKSPSISDIAKSIKQQGANFVANAVKSLQQKLEKKETENAFPAASAKTPLVASWSHVPTATTASYPAPGRQPWRGPPVSHVAKPYAALPVAPQSPTPEARAAVAQNDVVDLT